MSHPSFVLIALLGLSGCMTRSAAQSSGPSVRTRAALVEPRPEYAWDMAVCDLPQPNGHCDLREGASQTVVDISDNAFYVTVRSIGRGDVPVLIRLHKQRGNSFDGSSVGTPGRRVKVSPTFQFNASDVLFTHKFQLPDGVLHNGLSYVIVAVSQEEELYAAVTTAGGHEPVEADESFDAPANETPVEEEAPPNP